MNEYQWSNPFSGLVSIGADALAGSGGSVAPETLLASVPATGIPQTWSVCVTGQRYSGGTLTANNIPSDDQVEIYFPKVRIEWGVGGVTESAFVDVHQMGDTFIVHGDGVRLYSPANLPFVAATNIRGTLGGYIAPAVAPRMVQSPTFTTETQIVVGPVPGPAVDRFYPIPRRARAYQVWGVNTAPGCIITLAQVRGFNTATVVQNDSADTGLTWPPSGLTGLDNEITNGRVLHPNAGAVRVVNIGGGGGGDATVGIRFILDLG